MPTTSDTPPHYRFLFGPVPSRRFGRSLGIDLVPAKTCSLNCVFCQVGRTRHTTLERREYVPIEAVLDEFRDWLGRGGAADVATLSGAGEPTLHSRFGEVIRGIRDNSRLRTVLLTNGSLMHVPEVRHAAAAAHIVKVSVSAWDQASFEAVNRPNAGLRFDEQLEGMRAFRAEFAGELWVEVFIVQGLNDSDEAAGRMAGIVETLSPARVQLNTVVRPPAEPWARAAGRERLAALAGRFAPRAEIIASFQGGHSPASSATDDDVLKLIGRHPCSIADLSALTGVPESLLRDRLESLLERGAVVRTVVGTTPYYGCPGQMTTEEESAAGA